MQFAYHVCLHSSHKDAILYLCFQIIWFIQYKTFLPSRHYVLHNSRFHSTDVNRVSPIKWIVPSTYNVFFLDSTSSFNCRLWFNVATFNLDLESLCLSTSHGKISRSITSVGKKPFIFIDSALKVLWYILLFRAFVCCCFIYISILFRIWNYSFSI